MASRGKGWVEESEACFSSSQFTYGVVFRGFFGRKFCRKCAQNLPTYLLLRQVLKIAEILQEVCGNFAKILENFLQRPLLERPHR